MMPHRISVRPTKGSGEGPWKVVTRDVPGKPVRVRAMKGKSGMRSLVCSVGQRSW